MYQTVLFDLDGTLLNTVEDLAGAGNRVCAAHGWPQHTVEQFKHMVGNGIPKLVERFTPAEHRSPGLLAAVTAEFNADYHAHMEDATAPYPGVPELLARLKAEGVQMAVYSNKNDELARSVVAHYYDPALFDAVRGALPGVAHKPAPEGTLALLAALGADPAATLYVGDSDVDVYTAHNAGLPCCGVLWGFRGEAELRAAGADFLAADARALLDVVRGG